MKHQKGFTVIEVVVVLIVSTLASVVAATYYGRYIDRQANLAAADQMVIVSGAATQYIKDNYSAVAAAAGPASPAVITVGMLRNTGYLPTGFADKNAYGQDYRVLALRPTPNKLQTLVVTFNGDAIKELHMIDIAKRIGAQGGYVSTLDPGVASGSFGGWSTALSQYGGSPGGGHLASALFFQDGALVNDYLYRNAVPGHPELNEMNTAINMKGNDLNNAGTVNAGTVSAGTVNTTSLNAQTANVVTDAVVGGTVTAQNATVRGNADVGNDTYTGGWFRSRGDGGLYFEKHGGGWYMSDPQWLRSLSDKGILTGGEMRAGKLTSDGRTQVGEYLQLDGIAQEDGVCAPNGLVGRSQQGIILSCKDARWKKLGGSTPKCMAETINGYQLDDVTTYACPVGYTKIGWDTTGSGQRFSSTNGIVIGQNDYATIFCCEF